MTVKSESVMARTTKNMGLAALTRIAVLPVTAAAVFLNTNLVITSVGPTEYGRIMLIGSIFLLMPFADLGLGAVITNYVAKRIDLGDRTVQAVIRRCMKLLFLSAGIIAMLVAGCGLWGVWAAVLGLPAVDGPVANLAVPAAILPFILSLPLGVGQRILIGLGKNHITNLIGMAGPVASVLFTLVLVQYDVPALYLAAATPVGVLIVGAIGFLVAVRIAGWKLGDLVGPDRRTARDGADAVRLWSSALPMLVINITVPIAMQSHRMVISHLSPDELPEYSLAAQLYTPCYSVIATVAISLWPVFTRLGTQGKHLWRRSLWMMTIVGSAALAGYWFVAPKLAGILSENALPIEGELALSFGVLLLVMALHQPSAMLLTSSTQLRFQAVTTVIMFTFALGISVLITPALGAPGPVWASAFAILVCQAFPCIFYATRYFKES